jgi:predicted transcriptional regulator
MTIFQQIALYVWRWLTPQVEAALDPEYKARLDKVKADTAAIEKAEADAVEKQKQSDKFLVASAAIYAASEARRAQLAGQIAENQKQETLDEIKLQESKDRLVKIDTAIDALPNSDAIRGGV